MNLGLAGGWLRLMGGALPESDLLGFYKSVGSFEQDLALAAFVLRTCRRQGLGEEIAAVESLRPPRRA